jgi:membrane-associated phospholipid phosphatase
MIFKADAANKVNHPRYGFEVQDFILLGFLAAMLFLIGLAGKKLPDPRIPGVAFATVLFGYIAMIRMLDRANAGPMVRSIFRTVAFCICFPYMFLNLAHVNEFINPFRAELKLMAIDRALFGTNPVAYLQYFLKPGLVDLLQVSYVSYYFIYLIPTVMLVSRDFQSFNRYLASVSLVFTLTFVIYMLVPARSPYIIAGMPEYRDLIGLTIPVSGGVIGNTIRQFLHNFTSFRFDCFPSGHAAGAALVLITMARWNRLGAWLVAPLCAAVIAATIYLQYHYVIDIFAGIALAVFASFLGEYLVKRTPFWEFERRRHV